MRPSTATGAFQAQQKGESKLSTNMGIQTVCSKASRGFSFTVCHSFMNQQGGASFPLMISCFH